MYKISRVVLIILISSLFFSFKSSNEHLTWLDWNQGYTLAQKNKKIILIDVYTDWCGWCKRMDRDTYEKPSVVAAINENFVPVKLNPEKRGIEYTYQGKKYSPRELMNTLGEGQIRGYPATIFVVQRPSSNDVYVISGYHRENDFLSILKQIKEKSN